MSRRRIAVLVTIVITAIIVLLLALRGCEEDRVVVLAVGDMACSPSDPRYNQGAGDDEQCAARMVSDRAVTEGAVELWGLGDYQYELPSAADFAAAYDPTWGRLKDITRPALGNQELKVHKANTFYEYFGDRAGPRTGYWSFDTGDWHVVVLNTNCTTVEGGCGPESPQVAWLREDLASTDTRCIAALGHHPRWSNGIAGPDDRVGTLFDVLAENRVAMYLSGHEANYERTPALRADGTPDSQGVVQYVVGTGGQAVYKPSVGDAPWREAREEVPSEAFLATDHGYLRLTLESTSWTWAFVAADDGAVLDAGTATCLER